MKITLGLFLTLVVAVFGQHGPAVTEGLLAAQADLALSHRFFEQTVFLNRNQVSAYLYRINREILTSHIDTYAFIKDTGLDTIAEIEALETDETQDACVNNVLNRWNLQKLRYGHRLASCVNAAYRLLRDWNEVINELHATGMRTGNQVQNLGLKVLSETSIFDGRNSLPQLVNNELRELLGRALPYRRRFDDFVEGISRDVLDTIRELVTCDVVLEEEFAREVEVDLARARNCVGLENPGGEQTPSPTM